MRHGAGRSAGWAWGVLACGFWIAAAGCPTPPTRGGAGTRSPKVPAARRAGRTDKARAMAGAWMNKDTGKIYHVTLARDAFEARTDGGVVIRGERKGYSIEGTVTAPGSDAPPCSLPGWTAPATGRISEDGKRMEFRYLETTYQYHWVQPDGMSADKRCTGVEPIEKKEATLVLVRP